MKKDEQHPDECPLIHVMKTQNELLRLMALMTPSERVGIGYWGMHISFCAFCGEEIEWAEDEVKPCKKCGKGTPEYELHAEQLLAEAQHLTKQPGA